MLVQNSVYRNTYLTDGVNKDFYFSFPILEASQVLVQTSLLTDTGTVTTVDPGQYTVIGVGQTTGGHISFTTAPPSGSRLALTLNIPITQLYQYTELDSFPAKSHEDALAKLTLICQQFREQLERAVMLPSTSSESPEDVVQSIYASRDSAAANANTAYEARQAVAIGLNRASSEADRAQSEADRAQMEANRAQNLANIGPASSDKLGFVKIGEGITVDGSGAISVTPINPASRSSAGIVQIGEGLNITDGSESSGEGEDTRHPGILSLGVHRSEDSTKYGKGDFQFFGHIKLTDNFEESTSAKDGVGISAAGVKAAWDRLVGAGTQTVITTSGNWTVPETGNYVVTCVGGGGNGGSSGLSAKANIKDLPHSQLWGLGGGGGGGGGAGQTITKSVQLTKGTMISVVIGGSGGNTSFGAYSTALGGGNGGPGGPGGGGVVLDGGYKIVYNTSGGSGGYAGVSYGSAAGSGADGSAINGVYASAYGGAGGNGGVSIEGTYGNGGRGADAPTRINPGGNTAEGFSYGWGGSPGIQGCVKIHLSFGG